MQNFDKDFSSTPRLSWILFCEEVLPAHAHETAICKSGEMTQGGMEHGFADEKGHSSG